MSTHRFSLATPLRDGHPAGWRTTRPAGHGAGRGHRRAAGTAAVATAAFANPIPVGDGGAAPVTPGPPATVRVITTGGMAGWQIALIALGAALAPPPRPCSWTANWPAAAAHRHHRLMRPPAPRAPRLPDDRPPGLNRQAGVRLPGFPPDSPTVGTLILPAPGLGTTLRRR